MERCAGYDCHLCWGGDAVHVGQGKYESIIVNLNKRECQCGLGFYYNGMCGRCYGHTLHCSTLTLLSLHTACGWVVYDVHATVHL